MKNGLSESSLFDCYKSRGSDWLVVIVGSNRSVKWLKSELDHEMKAYGGLIFLLFMDSVNG